ncbi:LysM peptidoglycan-binding domain-containing protein [Cytobacillus firmus]|uniref:LysM peptidoglycan-binding domain-containing protein n=1 Tax=Cytobacillus firmus TaxID=1399 RepID=UPI001C8E002A|nr:LysM peptidoglycan-binding domain-containing protein [Cytobacillus firmus]MBX9976503.1 LysM peptidoglycan-binding domain-containing protein [Cytobacillus firmus]
MQIFYTVRSGDTLYGISRRWEIPADSLIAANNLKPPYTIYIGQQLSVPPGVDAVRVRQGDSVYRISQLYKVPTSVIIESNQLRPPYVIQAGQLLMVPPGVSYYVVQPGDTLYQLAGRFNVTTSGEPNYELIRIVNQLPSSQLVPGMKLRIPYAPPGGQGLIAYTTDLGGQYDIWLYNPRTGENVQLTSGLGDSFSSPEWSPNSRRIAFIGKNRIIYVVDVASGAIAQIDQMEESAEFKLDWSPDSSQIAYTKQGRIIMYNVLSHQAQSIQQPDSTDVQWFPSGRELLFQAPDESGNSQLFRMQTDGSGKQQITRNTGGRLNNAQLSPDGSFVLYTTPGVSISIIHTVELSTGNVFEVKGGPLAKNYYPTWSSNSLKIAYSATAFEDRGYFSQVRTVGRRGEEDRIWAISNCFASPVTWSTDGTKIAYLSGCKEQEFASEMWAIDLRHPVPIRLIAGVNIQSLQWSPTAILDGTQKTYTNTTYKVTFQYPSNWRKVNEERYEGADGFFQISAISAGENLDEVCHGEAFHPLRPYGSMPSILKTRIQNQEACYIFPSKDQPAEMLNQSALIVRYPTPITIQGETYNYFILWADQPHLKEIASSLVFL